ncbi:riboflavin synthase [Candidatus Peregrinibacteria bacterium]|nr:riboflavin synthase [Candidatus Peregrinibacteria bacterium]
MFTGIIEAMAKVLSFEGNTLQIERPRNYERLHVGQSIAVNGACLSLTKFSRKFLEFTVVPETLSRTNLAHATILNLERALPVNGRFNGHVVLGHGDDVLPIIKIQESFPGRMYSFKIPEKLSPFLVEKGSVALNGVSLTIAKISKKSFSVAIIPQTLAMTNFGSLHISDLVNIEVDSMAKYWLKWHSSHLRHC